MTSVYELVMTGNEPAVVDALLTLDAEQLAALEKELRGLGARPFADELIRDPWDRKLTKEAIDRHQDALRRRGTVGLARLASATTFPKAKSAWLLLQETAVSTVLLSQEEMDQAQLIRLLRHLRPTWATAMVELWSSARAGMNETAVVALRWVALGLAELPRSDGIYHSLDYHAGSHRDAQWSGWTDELAPAFRAAYLTGLRNHPKAVASHALADHVAAGRLPRDGVIRAAIAGLVARSGNRDSDARLVAVLSSLSPTPAEWLENRDDLALLLGHPTSGVVALATEGIRSCRDPELTRSGLTAARDSLPSLGKSAAFGIVDLALSDGSPMPVEVGELLAAGFAHPRAEVAGRCLDAVLADPALVTIRRWPEVELLPPSLRERAASLGTTATTPTTRVPETLPAYVGVPVGRGNPIASEPPDRFELNNLFAAALAGDREPLTWDRLLHGVTTLDCAVDPALAESAKRVPFEDARSLGRDLAATLYRWWSGEEVHPRSGGARHLADIWGARVHELMESSIPVTLLAPATCDRGTLDPRVLLGRLESLSVPPLEWDAQQALLRLDPHASDEPALVAALEKAGLADRPGADLEVDIRRGLRSRSRVSYGAVVPDDTVPGPPGWAMLRRPPRVTENLDSRSAFHRAELVRKCAPWHPRLVAAHLVPVIAGQVLNPEDQLGVDTEYILALTGLTGTRAGALGACLALSAKHADQRAAAVDVIVDGLLNGTADVDLLGEQLALITAAGDVKAGRLARALGPLLVDPLLGPSLCRLVRTAVVALVEAGTDRETGALIAALVEGAAALGGPPMTEPALVALVASGSKTAAAKEARRLRQVVGDADRPVHEALRHS